MIELKKEKEMNMMLFEMHVYLYMHVLTQSHVNVPIGALDNVLCLCIYLISERGHTSTRMTMMEKEEYGLFMLDVLPFRTPIENLTFLIK